jgi:hypothetical protein
MSIDQLTLPVVNNLPFIMQITFVFVLIYIWCLAALKLSQLALYHRVFALQLRIPVYIVGGIVVAWAVVFNFLMIFLCDPISQQWSIRRTGHCMDQILLLKALILTNMATDLMIVVLPIRCVWQLQMRKTEKFAVLACFGLGLACVVISIARFTLMYTIGKPLHCLLDYWRSNYTANNGQISLATSPAHPAQPLCSAPSSSCWPVCVSTSPCSAPSTYNGAPSTRTRPLAPAGGSARLSGRTLGNWGLLPIKLGLGTIRNGWSWRTRSFRASRSRTMTRVRRGN